MIELIDELLRPRAWVQIALLAVAYYVILNFIRGTRGAGILKGIAFLFTVIFLVLLFVSDYFHLEQIRELLRYVLSGSALALIILFAPELRRALSRLAQSPLLSPLLRAQSTKVVDELANAAVKLSKNRIGALVVIERDVGLGEWIENGVRTDAQLSSEFLETIFYPGSALHDGAVILQHDRVAAAACLLPLSDDPTLSKSMGTRHRAAIGIGEETDAVALVVSEETGRISIAAGGKLHTDLNRDSVAKMLNDLYARADRPRFGKGRREDEAGGRAPAGQVAPAPLPNGPKGPLAGRDRPPEKPPGSAPAEENKP